MRRCPGAARNVTPSGAAAGSNRSIISRSKEPMDSDMPGCSDPTLSTHPQQPFAQAITIHLTSAEAPRDAELMDLDRPADHAKKRRRKNSSKSQTPSNHNGNTQDFRSIHGSQPTNHTYTHSRHANRQRPSSATRDTPDLHDHP